MHDWLFLGPTKCLDPGNSALSHHALSLLPAMVAFNRVKIHKIIWSLCGASRLESDAIKVSSVHGVGGVVVHLWLHIISKMLLKIRYIRGLAASHNRGGAECVRCTIAHRQSIYHVNAEINASSDHKPEKHSEKEHHSTDNKTAHSET